jgi:hypothetical protein
MKIGNTPHFAPFAVSVFSSAKWSYRRVRPMDTLRRLSLPVLPVLLVLVESSIHLHAQTYTITHLGALPGNTTSKAYGLNNLGQAVGTSDSGAAVATLFSNGTVTNMNTLNASVSVATSISGSSQATGYNIFYSNPTLLFELFCTATEA